MGYLITSARSHRFVGKYVELVSPKKTVQEWRLTGGGWPDSKSFERSGCNVADSQ